MAAARGRRGLLTRLRDRLARARDRSRLADRVVRTVDRYLDAQGSLLAAGLTYYGFLAVFPLVAVGLGVASFLSKVVPRVSAELTDQLEQLAPEVDLPSVATAGIAVGVIGLAVMLYAGLRWVGHLRRSLAVLWGVPPRSLPYVRGLVRDIVTLGLLALAVLASVALTVVTELATGVFAHWTVFDHSAGSWVVRVASLVLALATDVAIGWVLFRALPDTGLRGRSLLAAAALTAVGFEVLKQAAAAIIAPASHNVVYGTFAATVGVLVWISYCCRWVLLVGAWSAVRPGTRDEPGSQPQRSLPSASAPPADTQRRAEEQDRSEDHAEHGLPGRT